MRLLAFDGRMGASGDMLLGALLDAGADPDVLEPVAEALDVEYVIRETTRCGIAATAVDVVLAGNENHEHDGTHCGDDNHRARDDGHSHGDHEHQRDDHGRRDDDREQPDDHDHDHEHRHAEGAGPHRTYEEVLEIVADVGLPEPIERDAEAIFELLGEAEASVHGTDLAETHFHEVGADDAIADVVGTLLLLDDLDVEAIVATPLSAGSGTVEMSHGTYPVPGPAVTEIAARADWTLRGGPVEAELLTPTGAAILGHLAEGRPELPEMDVDATGYGAGGYEFDDRPNVLRALVGDGGGELVRDEIAVLETNLDDAPPEVLGGLQETLADAGARDVTIVPTTMKKSRPGHLVKVIVDPADARRVARRLAEETGSLGVRQANAGHRWIATRSIETTTVEIGDVDATVDVKVASDDEGVVYDVSAEYDDAAAVARQAEVPIREVMRRAEAAVRERFE